MATSIHNFPLLDTSPADSDATKLHKTCIALRQIYNTMDFTQSTLLYGSLGGQSFGLASLKALLGPIDCQALFNYDVDEVDRRFLEAATSANACSDLAKFVRWATDIAIGFLYQDPEQVAKRASLGAIIMRPTRYRLQANTLQVYDTIRRQSLVEQEEERYRMALQILREFFDAINEHHEQVPDSEVGLEEILIVGKETTFVRQGAGTAEDVQGLHDMFVAKCNLPKVHFLEAAEAVIERQLREQQHPMPVEYALRTLAPVIPRLHSFVLQFLPVDDWSARTKSIGLEYIGREIVSAGQEQTASTRDQPHAPEGLTEGPVYNATPTHPSTASVQPGSKEAAVEDCYTPTALRSSAINRGSSSLNMHDVQLTEGHPFRRDDKTLRKEAVSSLRLQRKAREDRSARARARRDQ